MKARSTLLALALLAVAGCTPARPVTVRLVGGPTAVIELGGARFVTDPTFSPPGPYPAAPGRFLTKTEGPALTPEQIGPVDAVLLSHDQHADNLDPAGRAFVAHASATFSTPLAAGRLEGHVTGLAPWQTVTFVARNGRRFHVTGTPAQHGPDDSEALTGPVTGFLVASDGLPTVYVSGDNASLENVRAIAARAHVDVVVLFAGAAKSPKLLGDALLTLDAHGAAETARVFPNATIVPVHFRGWRHFTEDDDALRRAFANAGTSSRLVLLRPGESAAVP